MKKVLVIFGLVLLNSIAHAQQGLENIIVEKYYVSNAADATGSIGTLPAGSVTYRVYVDMLPGYEFQAAYGINTHVLKISTTTSFFNNQDIVALEKCSYVQRILRINQAANLNF